MKFQAPRGTRDFFPSAMAVRNWIVDAWRRVSLRNGFEEYDGPIFESLDLYRVKSGDEIVSELFHFTDRGGREFALRPEMTPTLARMAAAQANALPKPIKWFSRPRLCRAERPQRGRLREFFQWNIDVLGEAGELADAECIFVLVDFLREVGLTEDHFVVKINSRALLSSILANGQISNDQLPAVFAALDKRDKVDESTFKSLVEKLKLQPKQRDMVLALADAKGRDGLDNVRRMVEGHEEGMAAWETLQCLLELLDQMGVADCCRFDMGVVRGLAYYTGVVYEAFGLGGLQRAICGGGRYDELLKHVGGPSMPATGFATSDVVIEDLLKEFDRIPQLQDECGLFVIDDGLDLFGDVLSITMKLRRGGFNASYSYKRQSVGKQLKQATGKLAQRVIFVDERVRSEGVVAIKDLTRGVQQDVQVEQILSNPFLEIS